MSNKHEENMELIVRAAAMHDKVLANVINDNKILNYKVDQTDKKCAELEEELAFVYEEVQNLKDCKGRLTALMLATMCGFPRDLQSNKILGGELSSLSRELGYDIIKDTEGRYNVGFYKPYVCKVYLERYNLPIPPQLQYVKE